MLNLGWLFYEQNMLNKMQKYTKDGWTLTNMTAFTFQFEKAQPENCIFSMDYKEVTEDENEYFEIFKSCGWTHVCSYLGYHIFKAIPNTTPIYTDRESHTDRFKNFSIASNLMLLCSLTYLLFLYMFINKLDFIHNNAILHLIVSITGIASAGILGMSVVMSLGYFLRRNK